jgi:ABC-2 type transport system ATP-binding protein
MPSCSPLPTRPAPRAAVRHAIEIRGLRKAYGSVTAIDDLDLLVAPGEIYAFLGPNGAGKTTTVEILEGFRHADAGHVRVLGADPATAPTEWRDQIGIVLQESAPDPGLTVAETLDLHAGYHAHPRDTDQTLALVGLDDHVGRLATQLSGGQRRRLDLALAVIGDPALMFLDEPTTGFDPAARRAAWAVIDELRDTGTTIFLTTHDMDEAERLADRIGVIRNGRLIAEGTPDTLGGRGHANATISFTLPGGVGTADLPPALTGTLTLDGRRHTLSSAEPVETVEQLVGWARERGVRIDDLEVQRRSLEAIYLDLTASSDQSAD